MNAAQAFGQYLEVFRSNRKESSGSTLTDELNAICAKALPAAIESYRPDFATPDPVRPDALFAPDYGININRIDMPADVAASFRCGVPQLNSLLAIVTNDIFHTTTALEKNIPEGLTVCSLRNIPEEWRLETLSELTPTATASPAELINGLFLHDGVYIRVEKGVEVDKPIQIVNIFNSPVPMFTPRCVLIHACEGAKVRVLLCDHTQSPETAHLASQRVQIVVGENANVEVYDIEESSATTNRLCTTHASVGKNGVLVINGTFLSGGRTHNEFDINLSGEYADVSLSGLSICNAEQVVDNQVTLRHSAQHGTSRQLFKNALFDTSRGGFGGKIIVENGARFTDAAQTNRNLLVSTDARMQTAPQLEIYCDEVKCSHGATTGELDERALFYMQTRGIPREEARKMLTQAFMADVIDNISFEVLRQRIHILVEKRLSGAEGNCDTCATACHVDKQSEQ